jgi:phosphohistidine phosphatase
MPLYLVQHGKATTEEENPERPLTQEGVVDVRKVVEVASSLATIDVDRIVHSGKTRARQTAELWASAVGAPLEAADGLAPNDEPSVWADRLTAEPARSVGLMLVGHMPHLSGLAGLLVAGDAGRAVVAFRPGGLVALEGADDGWSVGLVLPPPT